MKKCMETISFYSYKGGVGRSLALAYTAKYLAERNIGVCVLDFDLEAPGVAYKFQEESKLVPSKLGVVDYVYSCITSDKAPDDIEEYFSTVYQQNKYGYIKVMNAGKDINTNKYWNNLSYINLDNLFLNKDGEGLYIFENLKRQIEEQINPDYLLIDSRSGITTMGKVCNSILPDKVVMFSANNAENFLGAKLGYNHISSSADYKINKLKSDIICAITRFPTDDDDDDDNDDESVILKKLTKVDLTKEADIIEKFFKIIDNPYLKHSDIFTIHSNRDIERNELLLLQKKQFARKGVLEEDYCKLIKKIIDNELLVKRDVLNKKTLKYKFIEFNLHEIIDNELKKFQGNLSYNEFYEEQKKHLAKLPNSCQLLYKYALCERYENKIIDSIMFLFSSIDDTNDDIEWKTYSRYLRGIIFLYDLYNYEKSIEDLEEVYNTNNSFNLHICYDLALCYYCLGSLGEYPKAIDQSKIYIENYISNNKQDHRAFLLRAAINNEQKEKKEQIIYDYNKAIDLKKDFVDSYNCRGLFYFSLGENENALKDYNKAIEIDYGNKPENQNKYLYKNRGDVYFKLNENENALKDYNKAIEIDSNYDEAYKSKGDVFLNLGKIKEAFEEYKTAYKINPNYKEAYDRLEMLRKPFAYYEALEVNLHYNLKYGLYYDLDNIITKYSFPNKYRETDECFEFALIKNNNKIIITDQGKTLKMLDKVFELSEHDVAKNLANILKKFRVFKNGFDFSIEINNTSVADENNKALNEAKHRLFRCVSFMNEMLLFYNDNEHFSDKYNFNLFIGSKTIIDSQNIIQQYSFPINYNNKTKDEYKFVLIKNENKYCIADMGKTYKMLDEVFELEVLDVKKNLSAIMQKCQVLQNEDKLLVEIKTLDDNSNIDENADVNEAKYRLLECVSFMDTMSIFYV